MNTYKLCKTQCRKQIYASIRKHFSLHIVSYLFETIEIYTLIVFMSSVPIRSCDYWRFHLYGNADKIWMDANKRYRSNSMFKYLTIGLQIAIVFLLILKRCIILCYFHWNMLFWSNSGSAFFFVQNILVQIRCEILSDPNAQLDLNNAHTAYTQSEARAAFQRMVQRYGWDKSQEPVILCTAVNVSQMTGIGQSCNMEGFSITDIS